MAKDAQRRAFVYIRYLYICQMSISISDCLVHSIDKNMMSNNDAHLFHHVYIDF